MADNKNGEPVPAQAESKAKVVPEEKKVKRRYPGKPVQVVRVEETGEDKKGRKIAIDEEALALVVKNIEATGVKKLYMVSVVGAMRTGKSFLLDLFLRYLTEDEEKLKKEGPECVFTGNARTEEEHQFYWRASSERTTTGIWFYSAPFVRTIQGQKVCVLLIDTQGLFDPRSPPEINKAIFGLSVLLSSMQILNVQNRIQEDTLNQLDFFTQFAHSAVSILNDPISSPKSTSPEEKKNKDDMGIHKFQTLQFLVRDWPNFEDPMDVEANIKETAEVVEDTFKETFDDSGQRERIMSSFEDVKAFFFPHIGMKAISKRWNGDLKVVEEAFAKNAAHFLRYLFDETVVIKRDMMRGTELEPQVLVHYIKSFAEVFKEGKLPEAVSLVEALTKATTLDAADKAVKEYRNLMDAKAGPDAQYVSQRDLFRHHEDATEKAIRLFKTIAAFGDKKTREEAKVKVEKSVIEEWKRYNELNASRIDKILSRYAWVAVIAIGAFLIDRLSDYTCDWWSDTCRDFSKALSWIYTLVALFIGGQTFFLYHGEGQIVVVKAVSGLFTEASTQLITYYNQFRGKAEEIGFKGIPELNKT